MREAPKTNAAVITTIPFDNILIACSSTSGDLKIGNTSGHWRQVSYEGQLGYVFDAYLELIDPSLYQEKKPKSPPAKLKEVTEDRSDEINKAQNTVDQPVAKTPPQEKPKESEVKKQPQPAPVQDYSLLLEAYNFCGAVEEIDPGILWYGFYSANEEAGEKEMRVEPVELEIVLSKSRSTDGLEFDIRTDRAERSLFLIGSTRPLPVDKMDLTDRTQVLRYSNQKVFPGQQINLDIGDNMATLAATGGIRSTGECPELDNYQLMLKAEQSIDLMRLLPKGQCGLPEIYWFGDINGDQLPDFIVVSIFEERTVFNLLLSKKSPLLYKAAEWTIEKCKD